MPYSLTAEVCKSGRVSPPYCMLLCRLNTVSRERNIISRDMTQILSVFCHTVCIAGYVIKIILDSDA